ncbi:hypothetical protein HUG17_3763 [Dermatophagoides farinae]|uniref:C2H2-type domain-containing protein n=1 Tax=Dermatophagoides farinae TaxID=6954 RepID=A0A9D4SG37_DERFA|nr:hypothetical protein HUG17_3763 [Dermatophagoides farinae]
MSTMDYVNQRSTTSSSTTINNDSIVNCRKCRRYERELNKIKDVAIALQHSVQILENIQRISREHKLITSYENDLNEWNQRYESLRLYQCATGNDEHIRSILPQKLQTLMQSGFIDGTNNGMVHHPHIHVGADGDAESCTTSSGVVVSSAENPNCDDDEDDDDNVDNDGNGHHDIKPHLIYFQNPMSGQSSAATIRIDSNRCLPSTGTPAFSFNQPPPPSSYSHHSHSSSSVQQQQQQHHHHHNQNHHNHHSNNHHHHHHQQSSQSLSSKRVVYYQCDHPGCVYQTEKPRRLNIHKRLHSGVTIYQCDFSGCGYISDLKGNLKKHKLTHTGLMPSSSTTSSSSATSAIAAAAAASSSSQALRAAFDGTTFGGLVDWTHSIK